MPMMASSSSVWPLPSTPATPRISPRVDAERDVVERGPAVLVLDRETACTRSATSVGHRRLAGVGLRQLAADHELGQVARRDLAAAAPRPPCARRGSR